MTSSFKRACVVVATAVAVGFGGTAVAQAAPVEYESTGSASGLSSQEDLAVLSSMSSNSDGELDLKKVQEWMAIGVTAIGIITTLMQGGGSSNIRL